MDASRFVVALAVLLVGIGIGRFVLITAGQAGDGMAALFVPPDRTLGWPRGVQESDEPWGWRPVRPRLDVIDAAGPDDDPLVRGEPLAAEATVLELGQGTYVVTSRPVISVTIRARPH